MRNHRQRTWPGSCCDRSCVTLRLPVSPPRTWSRLSRWALLATALLIGAALLATVWTTRQGVREASEALVRGQVTMVQQTIRRRLVALPSPPSRDQLDDLVDELASDGVRYLAVFDRQGRIAVDSGRPAEPIAGLATLRGSRAKEINGRIRLVSRRANRRGRRPGPRANRLAPFVVEIEPVVAGQLESSSTKALVIGATAAGTLLLAALALFGWLLRREREHDRLEQARRLASLGQMSAVLAHEIRNPLASLKGNAQLLARSLPEGDKPRAKADRVVSEAVRLEKLTNDLLAFAKTGAIERKAVDPAGLLGEAAQGHAGIEIAASDAPATWPLDPGRMRQVLVNLLDNATSAGSPVHATVHQKGNRLIYSICDSGPGIDESARDRLFEPFYSQKNRGTGLGLVVVKQLVELHGGTIDARNRPGGGAEFIVSIPEHS